ncbi:glycosyltransferase, partial [Bacillus timonensis]
IHGYYIHVGLLFKYLKSKNKPIVWTLHDCWPFTGHCVYFDFVNCPRWKTGCYECPQKSTYPSSLMLDKSNKNFFDKKEIFTGVKNMTIITPSKWLADLVKESFLGNYKVKVINNGIDLDLFKPTESIFRKKYKLENKFVILGVASPWSKRKGFESFIQLAKYLSEDERIVMVGLTEKQIKHLPSNIIGINRTDSVQELAEIYSMADVFVNPTLEDNFPTTNLESLACGTPVITFNTGGSVEAIREEKTGYIVKKGDIKAVLKKVEKIKSDGKEFYFQNCVDRANGLYDKNVKYHEYIEYYNSLLKV